MLDMSGIYVHRLCYPAEINIDIVNDLDLSSS